MPVDECTGIKQSGAISLGGTANQKANGANNNYNGSNIGSEFLGHTAGTESTAMSELYKSTSSTGTYSGGPVPNSDNNTGISIPTSGTISMSQFYKSSNALDPTDFISETVSAKSSLSSSNANGQFAFGRGGSNSATTAKVTSPSTRASDRCFESISGDYFNGFSTNVVGFDMILLTTMTRQGKGGSQSVTALTYSWMVRPFSSSSTYYAAGSSSGVSKATTVWTEIYKHTFIPAVNSQWSTTNSANDLTSNFRYAPSRFSWNYVTHDDSGGFGFDINGINTYNTGFSYNSGAGTNYYMPATSNNSTVYTVGDGNGMYSSNTADDWTANSVARGFRMYNTIQSECSTYYNVRYISMNMCWEDPETSSDGSNGNTNTFGAGYHTHTSPTFTFKLTQSGYHYGAC